MSLGVVSNGFDGGVHPELRLFRGKSKTPPGSYGELVVSRALRRIECALRPL